VLHGRLDAEAVEPKLLAGISELAHPPRIVAVFRRADLPRLEAQPVPVSLALWRVSDPGNVGTLIRAADALGPAAVCLSPGCADPTGAKSLRASAGAIFRVPLGAFADALRPQIALVPSGRIALSDLPLDERTTFVLGAERDGLPAQVVAACDDVAAIPLAPGAESLNVAIAGAIALYERRRRAATRPGRTG